MMKDSKDMDEKLCLSEESKNGINEMREYYQPHGFTFSEKEWLILWYLVPYHSMYPILVELKAGKKTFEGILFEFADLTYGDTVLVEMDKRSHSGEFLCSMEEYIMILEDNRPVILRKLNLYSIRLLQADCDNRLSAIMQEEHSKCKHEEMGRRNVG